MRFRIKVTQRERRWRGFSKQGRRGIHPAAGGLLIAWRLRAAASIRNHFAREIRRVPCGGSRQRVPLDLSTSQTRIHLFNYFTRRLLKDYFVGCTIDIRAALFIANEVLA